MLICLQSPSTSSFSPSTSPRSGLWHCDPALNRFCIQMMPHSWLYWISTGYRCITESEFGFLFCQSAQRCVLFDKYTMHPAQSPESNVSCQSCASYQLFLSAPSLFVVLPHSSPSPVFLACTSSPRTVYFVFKSSVLFSPCQVLRCVPVSLLICCPDVPSCLSAPCVAVILIKKLHPLHFPVSCIWVHPPYPSMTVWEYSQARDHCTKWCV